FRTDPAGAGMPPPAPRLADRPRPSSQPAVRTARESINRVTSDVRAHLPTIHFEWRTAHADESLRAGAALPEAEPGVVNENLGLPQRQPMANLAPGSVAPTAERADEPIQRDPTTISATYAAYARGLVGNRSARPPAPDDPRTPS
ncbi:MAG: hypothetical protein ACRDXX_01705, partial [Stackebrandtia sp.]